MKSTQRVCLLIRPRPYSYRKAIGPQNRVRQPVITVEDDNRCKQSHVRDFNDQNQTNKAIYCLTPISPNTLQV
jgi:hypothetical protein